MTLPVIGCRVAYGSNPFDPTLVWTEVGQANSGAGDVRRAKTTRGRERLLRSTALFQAGSADIALRNLKRDYDPTNTAGAHYPNVQPEKVVQLYAVWAGVEHILWTGFADDWPQTWPAFAEAAVGLLATDLFKSLAIKRMWGTNFLTQILHNTPTSTFPPLGPGSSPWSGSGPFVAGTPLPIGFRCAAQGVKVGGGGVATITFRAGSNLSGAKVTTGAYPAAGVVLKLTMPPAVVQVGDVIVAYVFHTNGGNLGNPVIEPNALGTATAFLPVGYQTLANGQMSVYSRVATADDAAGCVYDWFLNVAGEQLAVVMGAWGGVRPDWPLWAGTSPAYGNANVLAMNSGAAAAAAVAASAASTTPATNCIAVNLFQSNAGTTHINDPNVGTVRGRVDGGAPVASMLMSEQAIAASGATTPAATATVTGTPTVDNEAWATATIILTPGVVPTGVAVTVPMSVKLGDQMVAFVSSVGDAGYSLPAPVGWTVVRGPDIGGPADPYPVQETCFTRTATAGDPGVTYQFPIVGAGTPDGIGDLVVYSNVDPTTPVNVHAAAVSAVSALNDTAPTAPAVTTTLPGCLILESYAARVGSGTVTFTAPPAVARAAAALNQLAGKTSEQLQAAAGATFPKITGLSVPSMWVAQTIALQAKIGP
jgi:hypothetical protein